MARKKKNTDWLLHFLEIILFGTFLLSVLITRSLIYAAIITGAIFIILIVFRINNNLKYKDKLKKSSINDIDRMDGIQFEHYLGLLLEKNGYKTTVTRETGDYGADLVIEKDRKKTVVQAKRHSKNVGIKAVQEAQASIAHYGAIEAWVITNSDYTEAAYNLAKSNNVKLINRKELIDMILKMNPDDSPITRTVMEEFPREEVICIRCGSPMVRRKGPRGEFYGCSSFPKCRYTRAI